MYQIILPSVAKPSLCIWLHYLCFLSLDGDSVSRESTLRNDRHSIVSKMSAWVALGLYLSVAAWFAISLLLDFLFFFEILKYFSIVCEIWER